MPDTVALAFSGGLDTSYCVLDLIKRGFRVVTLFVDTGGVTPERKKWIRDRALSLGSAAHHETDGSAPLWDDIVVPFVMGGAPYAGAYPLLCADRTVIADALATLARRVGASAVAHGCTAMGNDQVRFDLALRSLVDLPILAPIRDLQGAVDRPRIYEAEVLRSAGFEVGVDEKRYSINENLLGVTMSGSEIDDFAAPDDTAARRLVAPRAKWPADPLSIRLTFDAGRLVALDGAPIDGPTMLRTLNERFGVYGVGRSIYTGDTVIGLKGRILFEAPGLLTMIAAHKALEDATLSRSQAAFKPMVASKWTELMYAGLFHDPLRLDLERFIRSTQQRVTGDVVLRTEGGSVLPVEVRSQHLLVDRSATYAQHADWSAADAEGFIRLFGLSSAMWCRRHAPAHSEAKPLGAPACSA